MGLFDKIFKRDKFPVPMKYPIEKAFMVGGIQYYSFVDTFNIPYERALKTITFYEEMRMRVTDEYLEQHVAAKDAIYANPRAINIFELKKLDDQLKERRTLAYDSDILYKLASIVFFDSNEDPRKYDFKYNVKKIQHWKKNASAHDFFLQSPLLKLIPYLKDADKNLEMYFQITDQIKKTHSETLSSIMSTK